MLVQGVAKAAAVLLTLLTSLRLVTADFEHTCSWPATFRRNSVRICTARVLAFIYTGCGRRGRIRSGSGSRGDALIEPEVARSFLTFRRMNNRQTGLTCECCVNRCTQQEFNQYCPSSPTANPKKRLRLRRRAAQKKEYFTESDVANVYDSIDRLITSPQVNASPDKVSLTMLEEMSVIKEWKLENIKHNFLQFFQMGSPQQSSTLGEVNVQHQGPPNKVTDDERLRHTSKPKIFSSVNTESPPHHHHRHKYPFHRDRR